MRRRRASGGREAGQGPGWLGWACLGLLLCWLAGCGAAWAGPGLLITGGDQRMELPLPGASFQLSWVHSVEGTRWRETFTLDEGGDLLLVASEFASAGAGLPDRLAPGEHFSLADGKMRLTGQGIRIPELRILLSGISHHYLNAGGKELDLNAIFGEGVVVIRAATSK